MKCTDGVDKTGGGSDAVEGADELFADVGTFSDAGEDELSVAFEAIVHGSNDISELVIDELRGCGYRVSFDGEATLCLSYDFAGLHNPLYKLVSLISYLESVRCMHCI